MNRDDLHAEAMRAAAEDLADVVNQARIHLADLVFVAATMARSNTPMGTAQWSSMNAVVEKYARMLNWTKEVAHEPVQ